MAEPLPDGVWNLPVTDQLRELESMTPELVFRYAIDEAIPVSKRSPEAVDLTKRVEKRLTHSEIRNGGLLRLYEEQRSADDDSLADLIYGFHPNGSFVTSGRLEREQKEAQLIQPTHQDLEMKMVQVSHPEIRRAHPTSDELLLNKDGLLIRIPPALQHARGIILHLNSLFGNDYETSVLEYLQDRGWALVHLDVEGRIPGPHYLERKQALAARSRRSFELTKKMVGDHSFTQRDWKQQLDLMQRPAQNALWQAESEFPMPDTGFEVRDGVNQSTIAGVIADAVDQHMLEHASAAAAIIGYLDDHRPDLSGKPLVIIGFSAGALATPTVAARLGNRVSAVVLIGGGATIYDIARTSTLTDGGITLVPESGPEPSQQLLDTIGERYRHLSQFDPYRTAKALRETPVLQIYGNNDAMVPTFTAETLWEQLGNPERLIYGGGHQGMFYFLPKQREFIAKWIESVTRSSITHAAQTPGTNRSPESP